MTNESRITPNSEPAERSEFEDLDHLVFPADIIRPRTERPVVDRATAEGDLSRAGGPQ